MDNAAMTEKDKDKIWDAIGKSWIVGEISTPEHSKRMDNAMMKQYRPIFEEMQEITADGHLAASDFQCAAGA